MTKLTADRIRALGERVLTGIEGSRAGKEDAMFHAGAVLMHNRFIAVLLAEIEPPGPIDINPLPTAVQGPWSVKSDGHRFIIEHLDGRVLSHRRGRGRILTPSYYKLRISAETRARELNDAEQKPDH